MLDAGIFDLAVHVVWMCYCIYMRLPLNTQRLDKTLLPMFLAKHHNYALHEVCSSAISGRISKATVQLYGLA